MPTWLSGCSSGRRSPLSIDDRRLIARTGQSRSADAIKPVQTYPGRLLCGHPARPARARRSGTGRAYLMFRVTSKASETDREQQQQQSGRRESNSRSQLGNLVGTRSRTCAAVRRCWSEACSLAAAVRPRPRRHNLIGHVAGTTCSAYGLRPRRCGHPAGPVMLTHPRPNKQDEDVPGEPTAAGGTFRECPWCHPRRPCWGARQPHPRISRCRAAARRSRERWWPYSYPMRSGVLAGSVTL